MLAPTNHHLPSQISAEWINPLTRDSFFFFFNLWLEILNLRFMSTQRNPRVDLYELPESLQKVPCAASCPFLLRRVMSIQILKELWLQTRTTCNFNNSLSNLTITHLRLEFQTHILLFLENQSCIFSSLVSQNLYHTRATLRDLLCWSLPRSCRPGIRWYQLVSLVAA